MSALDARIRHLAREELAAGTPAGSDGPDRVAELEQAVTSLHGTVLRLEARLDALEKAPAQAEQKARTAVRTRKAGSE